MLAQKFPQDIQCILRPIQGLGGIYISNIEAAENPETLKKYEIEAVITAIKGKNLQKIIPRHIQYLYIPAVDHQNFNISVYFQQSNSFIHEQRKRTNVLVHCMAGISRSVSLVIAYLIKHANKSYEQAYSFVKQKRSIIHPNQSFIEQLKHYHQNFKSSKTIHNKLNQKVNQSINQKNNYKKQGKNIQSKNFDGQSKQNILGQKSYDDFLRQSIKLLFQQKKQKTGKLL